MFVNKRLLIHTVQVAKPTPTNKKTLYGESETPNWQTLKHVRFEEAANTQGGNNGKDRSKPAKLFVYPQYTPKVLFDNEWVGGKVLFNDVPHKIITIKRFDYPFSDDVFSYEIEVI